MTPLSNSLEEEATSHSGSGHCTAPVYVISIFRYTFFFILFSLLVWFLDVNNFLVNKVPGKVSGKGVIVLSM